MNDRCRVQRCTLLTALLLAAACLAGEKPTILYITTTAGYHHKACEYSVPIIKKIARESGAFDVVCSEKTDLITPEGLKTFDAVCFSNTSGDLNKFPLSDANRNALVDAIKNGMPFIGVHATTDTYKDWEPFREMIGGAFKAHPWHEEVTIDIEDPAHPAAVMLPAAWTITDEIYTFKNYDRSTLHVIMSLNKASEKGKGNRDDGDYALAWSKMYGKGRVFYTALGHRFDVWDNPLFQQHLLGGIRWALGQKQSPLTPGHRKVAAKWERIFDGATLTFGTDWQSSIPKKATQAHWTVQPGGILQGHAKRGMPGSSHLYYIKKQFKNFEARAQVCISPNGNSGWYFRCPPASNRVGEGELKDWPTGFEFQINNHSGDPKRTGTFYPRPTLWDKDIQKYLGYDHTKDDGNVWFQMHIIAVGNHFVCTLNGTVANDYVHVKSRDPRHEKGRWMEGYFSFQMHHHGTVVRFKDLEVRELSPDFTWVEPGT